MKQALEQVITEVVKTLGVKSPIVAVEVPEDVQFGEYTTNVAMQLAKLLKQSPMTIALQVKDKLAEIKKRIESDGPHQSTSEKHQKLSAGKVDFSVLRDISRIEVVAPGFINFYCTEASLINQVSRVLNEAGAYGTSSIKPELALLQSPDSKEAQSGKIMVEFAHPNTHKAFHIGHLRNITTGESIIRLLEAVGYNVVRVNYQGDVGMHIAKALYVLLAIAPYKDEVITVVGVKERVEFLGKAYAAGSKAFEEDPEALPIIKDLNALIYASAQRYAQELGKKPGTTDYVKLVQNHRYPIETVYSLWKETRQWSLDYFSHIYQRVYTTYDRFYFESECLEGIDRARDAVKRGVLQESDGAIIFDGKPHGLDTRVFVNSLGLPTYEGKELALAATESTEYGALFHLIHVLGPEQVSFTNVTFKAGELLGLFEPHVQYHLVYGWVKLKQGKMSSRSGNVVLGEWLLDEAKKSVYTILSKTIDKYTKEEQEVIAEKTAIAAVKYAFLKVSTKSEIAFDFTESVNIEGDSGPYLMYTYARCKSVLVKSHLSDLGTLSHLSDVPLNPEEHVLARLLTQFPDVVIAAATQFAPTTLCTYLFDLAQAFNVFYAKHHILDQETSNKIQETSNKTQGVSKDKSLSLVPGPLPLRLALTTATAQVLHNGLNLLGIETVERM